MVKKYVMVRMPIEIMQMYKGAKKNMESDIEKVAGKRIPLTMPKVFKAVISPQINENYIQVDLKKLVELAKQKRGQR